MNEREHVIEVAGLRRRYGPAGPGGFEAVRGMDFTVRRGEVFALLGTNGAGKTSTVELLEGLAAPTGGRIRVLGHDPYRERALVRPRIGIMLQEGGFPSDLTVTETARMWAGCTTGARPVAEALEMVGLEDRAKVRVKQLSGGERRRLDLAMALVGRPEILFLDEPTTGLDPEARRRTRDLIRALRAGGTTVVLTTHYLEEAETLADRLAIMRAGRIVLAGTPDEVRAAQPSRIRFTLPAGVDVAELPAGLGEVVPDAAGEADAPRAVEVRSRRLQRDLTDLLLWARERDVELGRLDARSASLEEAFLRIAEDDAGAGDAGATNAEPVGAGA
ncbi:ATP-binding cassette domain-containing protein [Streptomyces alkaliphilus]|uniref:ABC-type xenobiotic transporter n=1 Tax=Streptomyces alkaliphilus TaxID=1472722 RepID=A0A7W3Y413_9ACTN|nr:ABC transporter ATP-binding protein [Streptomyces alkaliphilus]MBB0246940.1 ATP-binding cassette domain-containing protein [Streptomyces alkaliphilus]